MCTSIAAGLDDFYFGRTLDLDRDFGNEVIITPRNYALNLRCGRMVSRHLAYVGIGLVKDGYALYADAMNERGLCIAALNFPGNAYYSSHTGNEERWLAPFEIIPAVMSECATLDDARQLLGGIAVFDVPHSPDMPNTPLHWHIADNSGSIVFEVTRGGTNVYENPFGVLANNPPFPFHRDNMALYLNVSAEMPQCDVFGNGVLAHGMPGDYSSPSRFVRGALLSKMAHGHGGGIYDFFTLLGAVSVPRGSVLTADGKLHFTRYRCCMQTASGRYFFNTARDADIRCVDIKKEKLDGESLLVFDIDDRGKVRQPGQPKIL